MPAPSFRGGNWVSPADAVVDLVVGLSPSNGSRSVTGRGSRPARRRRSAGRLLRDRDLLSEQEAADRLGPVPLEVDFGLRVGVHDTEELAEDSRCRAQPIGECRGQAQAASIASSPRSSKSSRQRARICVVDSGSGIGPWVTGARGCCANPLGCRGRRQPLYSRHGTGRERRLERARSRDRDGPLRPRPERLHRHGAGPHGCARRQAVGADRREASQPAAGRAARHAAGDHAAREQGRSRPSSTAARDRCSPGCARSRRTSSRTG